MSQETISFICANTPETTTTESSDYETTTTPETSISYGYWSSPDASTGTSNPRSTPTETSGYSSTPPYVPSIDGNATPGEFEASVCDRHWLDKFCLNLGYHNLSFLTTPFDGTGSISEAFAAIDSPDGCIGSDGFKIIKATVVILLEHLINKKLKELCIGCEIDHPSQIRHSCLFEPDAYFFETYFEELSRNLIKPELKHILAQALGRGGLRLHPLRIQGSVDTILHELRDEIYIVEKLHQVREKLEDPASEKIIKDAVDSWKGYIEID